MPEKTGRKEKETYYFRKDVEVKDKTSELRVKLGVNTEKATFKISAFVTTEQVDYDETTRILARVDQLLSEALEFANARRIELQESGNDPAQIGLFSGAEPA